RIALSVRFRVSFRSPVPSSDSRPPPPEAAPAREGSARFTLRPPEWDGAGRAAREDGAGAHRVSRPGTLAEDEDLRARFDDARRGGERAAARTASIRLARWLAARDRDFDQAAQLAIGALAIGDDAELRREVAGWLEGLGDAARAAEVMAPLGEGDDAT